MPTVALYSVVAILIESFILRVFSDLIPDH